MKTDPLDESRDYDVDRLIDEANEAARLEEKGRLLKLRVARELDKPKEEGMTKEQINIAIAEWCGWRRLSGDFRKPWMPPGKTNCIYSKNTPPDYFNDLNAIHIAESTLSPNNFMHGRVVFDNNLMRICGSHQACVSATAPQRCEAILRTLGKWETKSPATPQESDR